MTKGAAACPPALNHEMARVLVREARAILPPRPPNGLTSSGSKRRELDPRVEMLMKPSGSGFQRRTEDERGSLRNVHKWVTGKALHVGKQIYNLMDGWLEQHPDVMQHIVDSLGKPASESHDVSGAVESLRREVATVLVRNRLDGMEAQVDTSEISTEYYSTVIRGHLLHYWARVTSDPAADAAKWTFEGAPAGLKKDTSVLDNVCPRVEPDEVIDVHSLCTDFDTFENYQGVEDDPDAFEALTGYAAKGYLQVFSSLTDLRHVLGAEPVLSKLGCIKKVKYNPDTKQYTHKSRIILDCKRSLVSKAATRSHKSVLPRVSDAVQSTLAMMSDRDETEAVTLFVADTVDAFWLIPLAREERRFFCAKLREKYYMYTRTAQGSRAAPLTFAVLIALAARWVQSIVGTPDKRRRTSNARVQVYVDDPLFTLRGDEAHTKRLTCIITLSWMIMGFPIAFHKAVLHPSLTWIGVQLAVRADSIEVEVPESKVSELLQLLKEALSGNVVSRKMLRTIVGKATSIASVLYVWRPFVQEMSAALHASSEAPPGCVWVKQIRHAATWLIKFLSAEVQGIRRVYSLQHYRGDGPRITITWDASPYGMGATLQRDGTFVGYFAAPIYDTDEHIFETHAGTSHGQQIWEALAGLVALRVWSNHWKGQRARLQIRGDNVGSLTLLTTLKGHSKALTLIASEYAMDLGEAEWRPDLATHLPGLTNTVCDMLSRKFQPGHSYTLPVCLKEAHEVSPPLRIGAWWKTFEEHSHTAAPARPLCRHGGQAASSSPKVSRQREMHVVAFQ